MVSSHILKRRALGVLAGAALATGALATPALAASEHYFSGSLSPGLVFGSTSAHTFVTFTESVSDHTACPGIEVGAAGFFAAGAAGTTLIVNGSFCAPGSVGWDPPDDGGSWHGAVYNPNASTVDAVSDTHYSW